MKNYFVWVSISILCMLCLVINLLYIKEKKNSKLNFNINTDALNECMQTLDSFKKLNSRTAILFFDPIFENEEDIVDIHKESDKIVLYIADEVCAGCVQSILLDLEILGDKIGFDKILIIGSLTDDNLFWKTIGTNSDLFTCVNNPLYNVSAKLHFPNSIFILDSNSMVKLLYIKEIFPEFNHEYFNEILPKYFNLL